MPTEAMLTTPRQAWFPGYSVAAVSAVALIATAPGQTMLVSLLNAPLTAELGLRPLTINAAYTVATVAAALPLVYVGALTDRIGPRKALVLVAAAFALACAAMAAAHGIVTVVIGFFLLRFLGQGSLALVAQHSIAMWFHRRLGSIQGIKLVVIFAAWVPVPLLTATMIDSLGWRSTWLIFGAAVALSVIPLTLRFVRDRPEDIGLRLDGDPPEPPAHSVDAVREDVRETVGEDLPEATGAGPHPGIPETARVAASLAAGTDWTLAQARRTSAFWILSASFFLSPLIGTALLFDMQPILERSWGPSADSSAEARVAAATAITVWTATMGIMSLPAGFLTDRVRARVLVGVGMVMMALSPIVLWARTDLLGAGASMALFAAGQSLVAASGSAAVARYYGRRHHGAIRASMARIGVIGAGLGPLITGLSVQFTDGYAVGLFGMALLCVPVAIAAPRLTAPPARQVL